MSLFLDMTALNVTALNITTVVFWTSFILVVYAYFLYPLLLTICAALFGKRYRPEMLADEQLPRVSLLIAAFNEEDVIFDRLQNALATDYPPEKFEVVVGSDGSSDRTAELVQQFANRGVRLLDFRQRRGKSAVLNDAMQQVQGEVVVLSDANTHYEPDAIRKLVRWFGDEQIGTVCGRLVLTDPLTGKNVDGMYWRYETYLKEKESQLGALLGANGAIYAIRKRLFVPLPPGTAVDDFVIPLLSQLHHGASAVYDREAVAHEETPREISAEFRRRHRIGAGGFQSIPILWRLLNPLRGWIAFSFLSHKVLRWLCPFFLLAMLGTNLMLARWPLYQGMLAGQALFYGLAAAGMFVSGTGTVAKLIRLTTMFASMNLALLVGFWRWISGQQRGAWQRTAR